MKKLFFEHWHNKCLRTTTLVILQWEKLFFIFSQLWHSFKWWSYDEGDGISYDDDVGNGDNNTDDDGDNDIDNDDDDDDDYRSHLSQQDFLSVAVAAPWARAISHNGVPYYIK